MCRLTERHCGVAVIKDKSLLKEAMEKLARYEETGLNPDEVVELNDFEKSQISVLLKELSKYRNAEKVLAEMEK